MSANRFSVLWPTRETYDRYRTVCDDSLSETFALFNADVEEHLRLLRMAGLQVCKIPFDPDTMARWCRATCGRVDENARRLYAAYLSTMEEMAR